jgi:cyclophilin family peptidyl-prolyl cis-trans isomerase/predicted DsbA family dithiol-disulfide isomerase
MVQQVTHRTFSVAVTAILLLASCRPANPPTAAAAVVPSETTTPNPNLGCTTVETSPTPSTGSLLLPAGNSNFVKGPEDAPATILVYCDLQSMQCHIFDRVLDQLTDNHGRDLRVIYRLFPVPASAVPSLDKSELSAEAAIAAGNQGQFWKVRGFLNQHYSEWYSLSPADFRVWILKVAAGLGLDMDTFSADLESVETKELSGNLFKSATAFGINSIPTVFINGQLQERAGLSMAGLESTISLIALGERQYHTCPPFEIDSRIQYTATLHTEKGDVIIRLYADRAPLAVNSFVFLARHGWFDGTTFRRVIPGFLAEAGDPSGTGYGGPGYFFQNEVFVDLGFDRPGVVGMANSGPDTNGSQFFITYTPQPQLDGSYTVFGQVIDGMAVLESLTPRDPQLSAALPSGDRILGVTIETQ